MGKNDIYMKRYLSDKDRFSDLFNAAVCRGEEIFQADKMREIDRTSELVVEGGGRTESGVYRHRDIMMESRNGEKLVLLAVENQEEVHYAMPVRGMLYDALNYTEQVQKLAKENKEEKVLKGGGEFLSGIRENDKLCPVITLVFYYGSKAWTGSEDVHGLLDLDKPEWDGLREFIPNYRINLVEAKELAENNSFKSDLQWILGMLKYKDDKERLKQYVHEYEEFFRGIDEDTFGAARALLGCEAIPLVRGEKGGGVDMCKALDDLYQDGVNEGMERGMEYGMKLFKYLLDTGKKEELERALEDKEYCVRLNKEYQL